MGKTVGLLEGSVIPKYRGVEPHSVQQRCCAAFRAAQHCTEFKRKALQATEIALFLIEGLLF